MKEIKPDHLLEGLAEDVSSMLIVVNGKKIRCWKFGGKLFASRYFDEIFQVSNSELLRDTIFKFAVF